MSHTVTIKRPLRRLTNGIETVEVQGNTVNEIFNELEERFPGIRKKLCERNGELHRFINVYVDGQDIRRLESLQTNVKDRSKVAIVTGIAGE
jgi:molybdopterin synthase sulfur carrier subunit